MMDGWDLTEAELEEMEVLGGSDAQYIYRDGDLIEIAIQEEPVDDELPDDSVYMCWRHYRKGQSGVVASGLDYTAMIDLSADLVDYMLQL